MKFFTTVDTPRLPVSIKLTDGVSVLGSCFADGIGARLVQNGFRADVNPFGTLYNPLSIEGAVKRLQAAHPFTESDCVEMGAGAGLICSFSHHTSFARRSAEEFLAAANERLSQSAEAWKNSRKIILTLGTSYVWKVRETGKVVANCLKLPASTFDRERISVEEAVRALESVISSNPDKEFILTVSPIRHLSDGAHSNTLSKAILQLACEKAVSDFPDRVCYFPAYEILLDELRDYRFYADDLVHPSPSAVSLIWERFANSCIPESERTAMAAAEKAWRRSLHRPLHD